MVLQRLTNDFLNSDIGQKVLAKLKTKAPSEFYFHDITNAAKGFLLTSLIHKNPLKRTILYLAEDAESALNLYLEVTTLTNSPVFYFPSQAVSPYDQIMSDPDIVSHQMKTMTYLLNNNEPCLVITTLKTLLEKISSKDDLQKNSFKIDYGSHIDILELGIRLVKLGYKKTTVVTGRGEFSFRGGIIDIYPIFGEPARISLDGEEIDSIRTFSLTSQRSQDHLNSVHITPRFYIVNPDQNKLASEIKKICNSDLELNYLGRAHIEEIKHNLYPEFIEYYAPLISQRTSSLFDYLPENTLVFIDDYQANVHSLENWYKRNLEIKVELEGAKKLIPLPEILINPKEFVLSSLKKYPRCYIERFEAFDVPDSKTTKLNFLPQERFNNQIDKFVAQVKNWLKEDQKIIIFSEQPQRIKGILREWDIPSLFLENINDKDFQSKQIFISREGTINGFKIPATKSIILTDTEIFGTKRHTRITHLKKETKLDKYEYYSNIEDLKANDFVVHIKHGIGKYQGLVKISIDNNEREYLMVQYASDGKLYLPVEQINLLYRYRGAGEIVPKLSKLGGTDWEQTKKKVKKAVKKIAEDLLNLYTARSKLEGFKFNPDSHWQLEMEEAFPYVETPDQLKAINDTKVDMESTKPMDRLICGDVGYGKTEVAIRAMFKAVLSGKQVAVLVPTTILAEQHYNVISERLAPYPVKVALLSRFKSTSEQREVASKLTLGEIDIVIGTHRLLQKDINFKDLGLVVIDEEQRFGVLHKERLKQLRVTVDVLTLSATPIPRTLHMALSGARDMSLINTPPLNRLPIKTYVGEFKPSIIKTAILHELERGGQVYFVHNRIETIAETASYVKELVPDARVAIAHGQMNDKDLEHVMFDFLLNKYNVLVCTTIIESGLDIPNANTIIVNHSEKMGLAQLYQLRGRVGRTDKQAYAYCLYPSNEVLTETAKNRLEAIKEFSTLGSGYQIAIRDMEIRGVGNLLGQEQHGHMVSVGFDLYCQLLNEAKDKLRGLEVHDPELETVVDLNISAYIPPSFIDDERQKIIEYKRLANVRTIKELEYINSEWNDRYGNLPEEVNNLIRIVRIRILGNELSMKSIKSIQGDTTSFNYIKIELNLRLEKWLEIQKLLPKNLIERTIFKSNTRGRSDIVSFIQLKTAGLDSKGQLDLLETLLNKLKALNINEKIA